MTLVSFVIPVYNAVPTLKRCLDSLLAQSESDWEALCINNGSTDVSLEILQQYAAKDKRFKIINQENKGSGVARNCGIEAARGKFLAFLDADDWLATDMVAITTQAAQANNADLVSFNAYVVEGAKTYPKTYYTSQNSLGTWQDIKQKLSEVPFHAWHMIYRTAWLQKEHICFSYVYVCEDVKFVLDAVLSAKKIVFLSDNLYYYRQIQSSSTHKVSAHFMELPLVMNEIDEIFEKHDINRPEDFTTWRVGHANWAYDQLPKDKRAVFLSTIGDTLSLGELQKFHDKLKKQQNKRFYIFGFIELCRLERKEYGWIFKLFGFLPLFGKKKRFNKQKYYFLGLPVIKIIH